jgi:hypothetical protein
MTGLYAVAVLVLVVTGVAGGFFLALVAGIRREERISRKGLASRQEVASSLTGASPGHAASAARSVCGLYTRGFERGELPAPAGLLP